MTRQELSNFIICYHVVWNDFYRKKNLPYIEHFNINKDIIEYCFYHICHQCNKLKLSRSNFVPYTHSYLSNKSLARWEFYKNDTKKMNIFNAVCNNNTIPIIENIDTLKYFLDNYKRHINLFQPKKNEKSLIKIDEDFEFIKKYIRVYF